MRIYMTRILVFIFFILVFPSVSIFSFRESNNEESYDATYNWETNEISLNFSAKIDSIRKNRAQAFYFSESISNLKTTHYLLKSVLAIRLNSFQKLESIAIDSNYVASLKSTIENSVIVNTKASRNLDAVEIFYKLPIFPNISPYLVSHIKATKFRNNLTWNPSENYTGLIIYAQDPLYVHGEYEKKLLNPALFVTFYDEDINIVTEKEEMSPDYLKQWGSVAYTDSFNEEQYRNRLGNNPIKTIARGIYGINYTDIILSKETVSMIWSNPQNNKILGEGRILIIISPKKIQEGLL